MNGKQARGGSTKVRKPERSSIEFCLAAGSVILAVAFPTTWWWRVILLLVTETIIVDVVWRSPLTAGRSILQKAYLVAIGAALLMAVGWRSVSDGYALAEAPDVTIRLVSPLEPSLLLINTSGQVAREIKYSFLLWNLDRPGLLQDRNPLQIPTATFDYIRPHEQSGPIAFFRNPAVQPQLKPGNHIAGVAMVTCPNCSYTRSFWVYIAWGESGWISEVPPDRHIDLSRLATDLPKFVNDIDGFFAPIKVRIPIENDTL